MQEIRLTSPSAELEAGGGSPDHTDEKFVPKGAMAFFMIMIVVYAMMWFMMYFDLLGRK